MSINPTGADVQVRRRVVLRPIGAPPIYGELIEVRSPDMRHERPYAMVKFTDMSMPVATDLSKLFWAQEPRNGPSASEAALEGPEVADDTGQPS